MAFFMNRFTNETYALMRIVTGFLFLWHGTQKLLDFPPMGHDAPAFIVYIAGTIELVGGLLVMIGFLTRPVAFLSSGLMAFAYWMGHGSRVLKPVDEGGGAMALLPVVNQGELAVLYCFVFLFIAAYGSGIWSVDAARGGKSA